MHYELQKASMPKRIAALLIDLILVAVIASGAAWMLAGVLGYDGYAETIQQSYDKYSEIYGVDLQMSRAEFDALPPEQQAKAEAGWTAMDDPAQNAVALGAKDMIHQLILIITSLSILLGIVIVEIVLPLIVKNGQTLGKKVFSLSVVRKDGIQINNVQLFVRSILGKYAVETMILVYALLALYMGVGNAVMILMAMLVIIVQLGSVIITADNCAIHDLMCGTVVVDHSSQMIFKSTDDLIAYQKKVAAERASRQPY